MASPVTVSVADGAQTPHIVKVSKHSVASPVTVSVADGAQTPHIVKVSKHSVASPVTVSVASGAQTPHIVKVSNTVWLHLSLCQWLTALRPHTLSR